MCDNVVFLRRQTVRDGHLHLIDIKINKFDILS